MNRAIIALLVLLMAACSYASMEMESGTAINASNKYEVWNKSIPYAIAYQGLRSVAENEYIVAFQDMGGYVFGLSNALRLLQVQTSDRSVLGSWPLTRWAGELEEAQSGTLFWQDYLDDRDWGRLSAGRTDAGALGCLGDSPLRYGEFTNPEEPVLVLLLPGETGYDYLDLVIFSTVHHEVIFSSRVAMRDEDDASHYPQALAPWQYQGEAFQKSHTYPGFRLYSKLFVADFDDDGHKDVIQWRKQYDSRKKGDLPGYQLANEALLFYKNDAGRYLMQQMDSAGVRAMLTTHNLTWQSGFPSKSECPGQEGELIPEMHDPLLNDPEVLQ